MQAIAGCTHTGFIPISDIGRCIYCRNFLFFCRNIDSLPYHLVYDCVLAFEFSGRCLVFTNVGHGSRGCKRISSCIRTKDLATLGMILEV